MPRSPRIPAVVLVALSVACGCSEESESDDSGATSTAGCTPSDASGCAAGQVCEQVTGGTFGCFAPVAFVGTVSDALDDSPIEGARVVARDANDAAISTVAVTDAEGAYTLQVPARRDASGKPASAGYTLRADAKGYQTFPFAPRVALAIDPSTATGDPAVVDSAATDIALLPLPDASGRGTVSGRVLADAPGGTLVVAGDVTGLADASGDYAVFNVPAGSAVPVRGYLQGENLEPATADVTTDAETTGVDLASAGAATAAVTGKISIVNGGGASSTSVILAVEETFQESAARGEAPKGLRAGGISGDFTIQGVPDGRYVVLAAFENDGLVRDPDTSIGGTEIVHVEVAGASQTLSTTFKVTGALEVVAPGASSIEAVGPAPTFEWKDDSSEDAYDVYVFDAFGTLAWQTQLPGQSGGKNVAVPYAGPTLETGMIYQFRAVSLKDGVPISATEDLRGVFVVE